MEIKSRIIITMFFILLLFSVTFFVIDTRNATFEMDKGKRFTYDDGVVLHNLCNNESLSPNLIEGLYGEKDTDFKQYLLEQREYGNTK